MKKKVLVAMSGGVDSSLAAALLLEQGYEVIGATLRLWPEELCKYEGNDRLCCSARDIEDARAVATRLGIPFYVLNAVREFDEKVIEYFCNEYENGLTPNPCIVCNEEIKFGTLLRKAMELGIDYVATGHYARVEYNSDTHRYIIREGNDPFKDQSYVLYRLTQNQLAHILLPIGDYTKKEVRRKSKELGLNVHDKPDSQELCFVIDDDLKAFLRLRLRDKASPGLILNKEGKVLGKHSGVCFFTVGQRKGLGLAGGEPLYVLRIDKENNAIIVGNKEDRKSRELVACDLNWVSIEGLEGSRAVKAKIRYSHPKDDAVISNIQGGVKVEFLMPQESPAPGQAVVFYEDDIVIGGGWIRPSA